MAQADWYHEALEEFMFDGPLFTGTSPEVFKRVYDYLMEQGLIDYDTEKEYLYDNYVEDEDKEDDDE